MVKELIIKHKDEEHIMFYDSDDEDLIKSLGKIIINFHQETNYKSVCFCKNVRKYKTNILSRVLMNAKKGECVDHIDHNTFNNCKNNLRIATSRQNIHNRILKKQIFPWVKKYYNYFKIENKEFKVNYSTSNLHDAITFAYDKLKEHLKEFNPIKETLQEVLLRIPNVILNNKIKCDFCDATFNTKSNKETHYERNCKSNPNKKVATCEFCKKIMTFGSLKRHLKTCKLNNSSNSNAFKAK